MGDDALFPGVGGCTLYDFRGVEGQPRPDNPAYGLLRFKQGFDSRFVEYVGQMDLPLRPVLCRLIRAVQKGYALLP